MSPIAPLADVAPPRRLAAPWLAALLLALLVAIPATPAPAQDIQRVVSARGIEAWLIETPNLPLIAVEFAFVGGARLDPPELAGRANLAAAMLTEGAGDLDAQSFQARLDDNAIQLGFSSGSDGFYGSLKTATDTADDAFDLLRLALTAPRFDADPLERRRGSVLAGIRQQVGNPGWMARRALFDEVFADHPYGQPSRGTAATLAGLGADDLRAYVDQAFRRDRLVIGVNGDLDADTLARRLDEVFGELPADGAVTMPDAPDVAASAGRLSLVTRDGAQSELLLAQPAPRRDDPDHYAAHLLNHIVGGGGLRSRLSEEVRSRRGLSYSQGSSLAQYDQAGLWLISVSLSDANVGEAIEVIGEEWRRVARDGVTAEELDDAKTYLIGSYPLAFTSTDRVAGALLSAQIDNRGLDFMSRRQAAIEAVTLDEVNDVARRWLDAEALTTVIVGRPDAALQEAADRTLTARDLANRELAMPEGG